MFSVILFLSSSASVFDNLNVSKTCEQNYCFPLVVWSHWDNDILPKDVEEMVNVTKKSLKTFTHCLLTPSNISNFLSIENFPDGYNNLQYPQVKADYVRVCLLAKYGGVYIDASTFITSGEEMEWFCSEAVKARAQIISFRATDHYFFSMSIEFFGAPQNSVFMEAFKTEFDVALQNKSQYVLETCKQLQTNPGVVNDSGCSEYMLISVVLVRIAYFNEQLRASAVVLPIMRGPARLTLECKNNKECIKNRLLHDPVARTESFIKLYHPFRDGTIYHLADPKYSRFYLDPLYTRTKRGSILMLSVVLLLPFILFFKRIKKSKKLP